MEKIRDTCALIAALLLLAACTETGDTVLRGGAPTQDALARSDIDPALLARTARFEFGAAPGPSAQSPAVHGNYSRGCLAGGVELAENGPSWQAMRLSRNRNWGHPVLVDFIQDLSRTAAAQPGWNGLYVGDMTQPRGGPMRTGHRSHQNGLDVDVWMLPPRRLNLTAQERESLSSISTRRAGGAFTNDNWSRGHHEIIKAAAQDPRTTRIFVFPGAKVRMCNEERGDRSWLRKVRPLHGHHYHFHIRLACPRGERDCVAQEAPPPGDGCAEAQQWVDNILSPPPPDPNAPPRRVTKHPRDYTMSELPLQCSAVLASR